MTQTSIVFTAIAVLSVDVVGGQTGSQVAGYSFPATTVAPGQVISLFVRGLDIADATADSIPLPATLNGISVAVENQIPGYPQLLPIFSIHSYPGECKGGFVQFCGTTAVTVQIPTEPTCISSGFPNDCTSGPPTVITFSVKQNGTAVQQLQFFIGDEQPHILKTCDTIMAQFNGCYSMVTHANGHPVSTAEPAKPGETIVLYAVGLGSTTPTVKTGTAAPSPGPTADLFIPVTLSFAFDVPAGSPPPPALWVPTGQWIQPVFAGLVPGFVGLYQVNLPLPKTLPGQAHRCQSFLDVNTRISIGNAEGQMQGIDTADICVQP